MGLELREPLIVFPVTDLEDENVEAIKIAATQLGMSWQIQEEVGHDTPHKYSLAIYDPTLADGKGDHVGQT